jgi:hypothetical protein
MDLIWLSPYAAKGRVWAGVKLLQSQHWWQGFLKRFVCTLCLSNNPWEPCVACDTLRNMSLKQDTERDRCFKPDKPWRNSFLLTGLNYTAGLTSYWRTLCRLLSIVSVVRHMCSHSSYMWSVWGWTSKNERNVQFGRGGITSFSVQSTARHNLGTDNSWRSKGLHCLLWMDYDSKRLVVIEEPGRHEFKRRRARSRI